MARNASNRQIEQLDGLGAHRDLPNNGPAVETANARVELVGPMRQSNVTASQTGVQLSTGIAGTDGQPGVVAHSSGKILGLTYSLNAAVTAGGATAVQLQATVAPAATLTAAVQGDLFSIPSQASPRQAGAIDMTASAVPSEIAFKKGDVLGVQLTTSAGFLPVTADLDTYLIVRWDASPAVPA